MSSKRPIVLSAGGDPFILAWDYKTCHKMASLNLKECLEQHTGYSPGEDPITVRQMLPVAENVFAVVVERSAIKQILSG